MTTAVRLRVAFIAAALAWTVLLFAAPLLAGHAHASTPVSLLVLAVYAIGSAVCHQLPERSYQLWTVVMPVCARCTGIYVGAAIGALAAAFRPPSLRFGEAEAVRHKNSTAPVAQGFSPASTSPARIRLVLALAAVPTVLTLVFEWTSGVMPPHAIRAVAGASIGAAVAWQVVAATGNQVN